MAEESETSAVDPRNGGSLDTETAEANGESEFNGRHVRMDAGFYEVQVHGDPDDTLADLVETALSLASRARNDIEEMDGRMEEDGRTFS